MPAACLSRTPCAALRTSLKVAQQSEREFDEQFDQEPRQERGSGGLVAALLVLLLAGYVGSYIGLSRRGFSYARSCAKTCFYFFPPASGGRGP